MKIEDACRYIQICNMISSTDKSNLTDFLVWACDHHAANLTAWACDHFQIVDRAWNDIKGI